MVHLRSRTVEGGVRERHLVTGGGGYVGLHLGLELLKQGHHVVLFDIRQPVEAIPKDIQFLQVSKVHVFKEFKSSIIKFIFH